jgi:AraC-like DNA-binding protein
VAVCEPVPALRGMVDSMWYGEGQVSYARDRILPSGQSQLLINLGPPQYRVELGPPERHIPFVDIWYSGLHQGPIDTEAPHGNALLGVAFSSRGVYPWLGAALEGLGDRVVALADVLGDGVLALRQRLLEATTDDARFERIEHWLIARLSPRTTVHPAVQWSVDRLQRTQGRVTIETLSRETGFSRKHLASLFLRQIGLTPKALGRVQRFRGALALLQRSTRMPWTELALQSGYFDQSHLVREFRAMSGLAPSDFLRRAQPDAGSIVIR